MQRQTPKRNRRFSISLAAMIMLLSSSVGCLSVKHHLQRHSVVATVALKHQGRYYHCPHCGQIIPREGFSKCPRCFQVPVYHGYEPTCWRQWPEGWGCPPESVINDPEFLQQGMVESDSDLELLPEMEDLQAVETTKTGDGEPSPDQKQPESPEAEVDNGEVSMPLPQNEIVATEHSKDAATETIPSASPVDPIDSALADDSVLADDFVDIEPPASFDAVGAADEPAQIPQTEAPAAAAVAPVFEIVNRIPIPTTKSTLITEQLGDTVDAPDPPAAVPSLVRPSAPVINVMAASVESKSVLVVAKPASRINPHDEQGPIPVRGVRLASTKIDPKPTQRKEPSHADGKEEYPTPVNRVALPELVPSLSSGADQPMPIRRIQLSELPVKIPR